jgi:hypothetical protein
MAKAAATATLPETPDDTATPVNGNGSAPEAPEAPDDPLPDPADLNNQTVDITFRGVTVSVPKRQGRWDIDGWIDMQEGRPGPGMKKLLGPEQWARLKKVCPTPDDFDEFAGVASAAINENCVA